MKRRPDEDGPQAVNIAELVVVLPDGSMVPIRDLRVIVAPATMALSEGVELPDLADAAHHAERLQRRLETERTTPDVRS